MRARGAGAQTALPAAIRASAAAACFAAGAVGLSACVRIGDRQTTTALEAARAREGEAQKYREVDPNLLSYTQVQAIPTGLAEPRGLTAGPDGRLYVAGDREVRAFSPDGVAQPGFALPESPRCVAADRSGGLWVGFDAGVGLYGLDGAVKAEWPVRGAHALVTCVTPSGDDVWVADAGDRVVLRYSRSGRLKARLGARDDGRKVPGLVVPSRHLDVLVRKDGGLLVNNPGRLAVEAYKPDGTLVSSFGKASMSIEGFCGCCNPTDLALLPDGRVVTAEKGIPRVKVYRANGTLDCVVAAPADLSVSAESGLDLAADGEGRVYVLDPHARVVRVFAARQPGSAKEVAQ